MNGDLTTDWKRKSSNLNISKEYKYNGGKEKMERKFRWGKWLVGQTDMTGKFIKTTAALPSGCTNPEEEQTEVQHFYKGADVFITGATGFVGKILIEKLLTSCPNIGNLYLLIREKKGKTASERFDILFQDDIFSRLRKLVPDFRRKLIAVNGDISRIHLGMSDSDYEEVTKHVSIIFHGAANVRFDEALKSAVDINIKGVLEILKLAKKCHSLKSIMHVSTVYSNCTVLNKHITEEFYPTPYDYKKLIKIVETESDEVLENMTKSFIKPWPNTYAFTKQIAEGVLLKEGQDLPIGILRPGIIIATYNEPLRGWTDNIYGPTGVIVGVGTGVLRVINVDKEAAANMVPVDMVVNGLIAAAWKTAQNYECGNRKIEIYNYVSANRNPIRWGEFSHWSAKYGQNWPTVLAIWYNEFHLVRNRLLFLLLTFFLHTLPSYIMDGVLVLCGKKPKMVKLYRKIDKFGDAIAYFSTHTWTFSDDNTLRLWKSLSAKDRAIYPFDIAEMDWDYHSQAHPLGLRVHLIKDDVNTLEEGRKKWKRLKYLHRCLQSAIFLVFIYFLYKLFLLVNLFI